VGGHFRILPAWDLSLGRMVAKIEITPVVLLVSELLPKMLIETKVKAIFTYIFKHYAVVDLEVCRKNASFF
jgi:hypothetical protein